MSERNGSYDPLAEAWRLARDKGFVIATVQQFVWNPVGPDYYVEAYVLYRNRARIGRRRSRSALLALLKKTIAKLERDGPVLRP